jgi:hypothetical protein
MKKGGVDMKALFRDMVDRCSGVLVFDWLVAVPGAMLEPQYDLYPCRGQAGLIETLDAPRGCLAAPLDFIAASIHCFYGSMISEERAAFRQNYSIEFIVLEQLFYRCPLVAIPFEGCLLPAKGYSGLPEKPIPQPGQFGNGYERYIPPLMPFRMRLVGKPYRTGGGVRFLPLMKGWMERPVL